MSPFPPYQCCLNFRNTLKPLSNDFKKGGGVQNKEQNICLFFETNENAASVSTILKLVEAILRHLMHTFKREYFPCSKCKTRPALEIRFATRNDLRYILSTVLRRLTSAIPLPELHTLNRLRELEISATLNDSVREKIDLSRLFHLSSNIT